MAIIRSFLYLLLLVPVVLLVFTVLRCLMTPSFSFRRQFLWILNNETLLSLQYRIPCEIIYTRTVHCELYDLNVRVYVDGVLHKISTHFKRYLVVAHLRNLKTPTQNYFIDAKDSVQHSSPSRRIVNMQLHLAQPYIFVVVTRAKSYTIHYLEDYSLSYLHVFSYQVLGTLYRPWNPLNNYMAISTQIHNKRRPQCLLTCKQADIIDAQFRIKGKHYCVLVHFHQQSADINQTRFAENIVVVPTLRTRAETRRLRACVRKWQKRIVRPQALFCTHRVLSNLDLWRLRR